MAKAIHSMIRVRDERASIDFYDKAFGFKIAERLEFEGFALVYLRNDENDFEIELTVNFDQSEAYTHGTGYGHLAVCVDDVKSERERLINAGFRTGDIKEFAPDDRLLARFFFIEDPDGYKIEVLERHGRYQ